MKILLNVHAVVQFNVGAIVNYADILIKKQSIYPSAMPLHLGINYIIFGRFLPFSEDLLEAKS
jgi:hypothetical protein